MFTLDEILAVKPPNSPIGDGPYWQSVLTAAEAHVKTICGRQLEATTYTDEGETIRVENGSGYAWVWYLREPTGSTLQYSDFSLLTLNGTAVAENDVTIEPTRLVFSSGGTVKATYPGGYLQNATAAAVIKAATVAAMHAIHTQLLGAGVNTLPAGGVQQTVAHGDAGFESVKTMLSPYIAVLNRGD